MATNFWEGKTAQKLFFFSLVLLVTLFYYVSGKGVNTKTDFFIPLAQGFVDGRLHVERMNYYLHEMITLQEIKTDVFNGYVDGAFGTYFVIYPPLPAVMLMPVVVIWKEVANQSLFSIFIASLSTAVAFLTFKALKMSFKKATWLTVFLAFGSIQWFHAVMGSAWYLSLICAMFFLWLAIYGTFKKFNLFFIGLLLGLAYLSRFPTILSLPFFLIMTKDSWLKDEKVQVKTLMLFFLGIGLMVTTSFVYNWLRYKNIWHVGYAVLERRFYNIENEYRFGSYSFTYFPRHLKAIFWSFPNKISSFPYFIPNQISMALWLVMPALILAFWAPIKKRLVWASWLAILLIAVLAHFFHGGVGASQFGYRYVLDYLPFLFLIIAEAIRKNYYWWQKALIALSVFINFWGIYVTFWLR